MITIINTQMLCEKIRAEDIKRIRLRLIKNGSIKPQPNSKEIEILNEVLPTINEVRKNTFIVFSEIQNSIRSILGSDNELFIKKENLSLNIAKALRLKNLAVVLFNTIAKRWINHPTIERSNGFFSSLKVDARNLP